MLQYNQFVEKISRSSGKTSEEINRLVEAKRAKLSGLISREGAAQIIAAELGINFDKEKSKVNELIAGMKKVNIIGKIIKIFPIREYHTDNREGKIASFILADETGNIRTVLWDTNHISLIEKGTIKEEEFVEISNANFRNVELHLTGFSDIKKSNEFIADVKTELEYNEKKINELGVGGNFKVRAFIVQAFEPKFFETCPECNARVSNEIDGSKCEKHGKIIPRKRALLSLVLDDGSANMRGVLFSEQIEKLDLKEENLMPDRFPNAKNELLGREIFFLGNVRQNRLFNTNEFFVSDLEEIDVDKLIESLEK